MPGRIEELEGDIAALERAQNVLRRARNPFPVGDGIRRSTADIAIEDVLESTRAELAVLSACRSKVVTTQTEMEPRF